MMVMTGAFAVGDISGGASNPAVAIGISILGISSWGNLWIYLLANFAAAAVAAVVFNLINPPTQTTPIATDDLLTKRHSNSITVCGGARRSSASQNDVFFCPSVDLAAMRTGEFGSFDFRCSPELFFDSLTGRGEFCGGRTPHEKPFNDWSGFYLAW